MNTADVAIIAVTAVGLANAYWNWKVQMKVADRLRLVNPTAPPKDKPAPPEPPASQLDAMLDGQKQASP